ncbi:MAG: ABC transporter ATP-binding protein [Thermodesulfobacteriota bacterium]
MLELRQVTKYFGGLPALDDVSFGVPRGEITALIGPNGAGKSTLINCISGILERDSGEILFKGSNIAAMESHEIARIGISRTFQNLRIVPGLSVLDNVLCGLTVHANSSFVRAMLRPPSIRQRERYLRLKALNILDTFGLTQKASLPMDALPYGDKKRVELARAFVAAPDLVLLDEPVAGLNHEETAEIAILIRRMRNSGHTVLIVEHDMDLVMDISDSVVVLDSGKCIARGTPEEIRVNPLVLTAYLGSIGAAA